MLFDTRIELKFPNHCIASVPEASFNTSGARKRGAAAAAMAQSKWSPLRRRSGGRDRKNVNCREEEAGSLKSQREERIRLYKNRMDDSLSRL